MSPTPSHAVRSRGVDHVLLLVFFMSGFAAVAYQVCWQRLLTLYYGSGSISIAIIVSVYMCGLGFGALAGGAAAERVRARIALYCGIEVATSLFGAVSPSLLQMLGVRSAGSDYAVMVIWLALFLLIPTFLMGMTLPVVTKIFNTRRSSYAATVSYLYAINTLGAALGALLTSYVIVSVWGLDAALYVAAAINLVLAVIVWLARRSADAEPAIVASPEAPGALGAMALPAVVVTGFLAIGYELVWFRLLGIVVKDSPYAFASGLAVYLAGVGLGSLLFGLMTQRTPRLISPGVFFAVQWLIACYGIASIVVLYRSIGRWWVVDIPLRSSFFTITHPSMAWPTDIYSAFTVVDILFWPALLFLVPTILMGASFPLVASLAIRSPDQEARSIAIVYTCATVGNVAGALVTGFVLLPWLQSERTLLLFAVVGVAAVSLASPVGSRIVRPGWRVAAAALPLIAAAVWFPGPNQLVASMHLPVSNDSPTEYVDEGRDGIVVTFAHPANRLITWINGSPHGGRPGYGFYYEAIEALSHIRTPRHVLVIGFGTGSTVEQVLADSRVERVTLVEINATLLTNLRRVPVVARIMDDPRLEIIIDDGRRHLLRATDQFDAVMLDPVRTRTAYSNNLYSVDMAELVRARLAPSGVAMVWTDDFGVLPRTWATAFPHVKMHPFFLLVSRDALARDGDIAAGLAAAHETPARTAIVALGSGNVRNRTDVLRATSGCLINEDARPVTEYFLGPAIRKALGGNQCSPVDIAQ